MTEPFIYEGEDVTTLGKIMDRVAAITRAEDRDEAAAFMRAYSAWLRDNTEDDKVRQDPEGVAASNIGYASGYFDRDMMAAIQQLFAVAHPVFGNAIPTPKESFAMGVQRGEAEA